jgi:hypothetical protein
VIKMFAKIGAARAEPGSLRGGGDSRMGGALTPATAQAEIRALQSDTEFFKVFADRSNPGYRDAKARWDALHVAAYGRAA